MSATDEPGRPDFSLDEVRREGLLPQAGGPATPHDGTGRVDLRFSVQGSPGTEPADRAVRVPPGVSVFDAASWNGIAIDSTCGGHGTCHKCKVRLDVASPVTRHDERTFSAEQLAEGWRLACLVSAVRDLAVDVPPLTTRPKAATVGVGRQVILRPQLALAFVVTPLQISQRLFVLSTRAGCAPISDRAQRALRIPKVLPLDRF